MFLLTENLSKNSAFKTFNPSVGTPYCLKKIVQDFNYMLILVLYTNLILTNQTF